MSWWGSRFADTLSGLARNVFDRLLRPASDARDRWVEEYQAATDAVEIQIQNVTSYAQAAAVRLNEAQLAVMHRQSVEAANLAYAAFHQAQTVLDALGMTIVETAKMRNALAVEYRAA